MAKMTDDELIADFIAGAKQAGYDPTHTTIVLRNLDKMPKAKKRKHAKVIAKLGPAPKSAAPAAKAEAAPEPGSSESQTGWSKARRERARDARLAASRAGRDVAMHMREGQNYASEAQDALTGLVADSVMALPIVKAPALAAKAAVMSGKALMKGYKALRGVKKAAPAAKQLAAGKGSAAQKLLTSGRGTNWTGKVKPPTTKGPLSRTPKTPKQLSSPKQRLPKWDKAFASPPARPPLPATPRPKAKLPKWEKEFASPPSSGKLPPTPRPKAKLPKWDKSLASPPASLLLTKMKMSAPITKLLTSKGINTIAKLRESYPALHKMLVEAGRPAHARQLQDLMRQASRR